MLAFKEIYILIKMTIATYYYLRELCEGQMCIGL